MERKELIEVHSPEEIPEFASEKEEAEFWSTHSLGDEFWEKAEPRQGEQKDELLLPPSMSREELLRRREERWSKA